MSKFDKGKPEPTLVYYSMIKGIAAVRRFGINKYGSSEDWRTTQPIKHFDALLRHLFDYLNEDECDTESKLPHLYHAAANIMFEIERNYGPGKKDLISRKYKIMTIHESLKTMPKEIEINNIRHEAMFDSLGTFLGYYPCVDGKDIK